MPRNQVSEVDSFERKAQLIMDLVLCFDTVTATEHTVRSSTQIESLFNSFVAPYNNLFLGFDESKKEISLMEIKDDYFDTYKAYKFIICRAY